MDECAEQSDPVVSVAKPPRRLGAARGGAAAARSTGTGPAAAAAAKSPPVSLPVAAKASLRIGWAVSTSFLARGLSDGFDAFASFRFRARSSLSTPVSWATAEAARERSVKAFESCMAAAAL